MNSKQNSCHANNRPENLLNDPTRSAKTTKDHHTSASSQQSPQLLKGSSASTLTICRNKYERILIGPNSFLVLTRINRHWRYISSFHGPWLQLPPEVLESLAYSNYFSPRPRPIDPAVFFDLVKIRRLIEEATHLAVRASNGTTSSALSSSLNASNGMLYGNSAAALGLGIGGSGGGAKLSRERKHRIREHATQKLSHAFQLDEIAASVATMQSTSSLEEVAKYVLQRHPDDPHAKYVHFFHEKIPSRALSECTSLKPLDEIIVQRPTEGAPFRTRAVTRILKEDFVGAAKDLTDGLAVCRLYNSQHQRDKLQIARPVDLGRQDTSGRLDGKLDEHEQPNSLEPQLLFHRAGAYLTIACDYIDTSLNYLNQQATDPTRDGGQTPAQLQGLEARKLVRTYAKRALRDYLSFLSHLDYTPGLPKEITEDFFREVHALANGSPKPKPSDRRLLEYNTKPSTTSSTIIRHDNEDTGHRTNGLPHLPSLPSIEVHSINALFSAVPPPNLPPYPPNTKALVPAPRHHPLHASDPSPSPSTLDLDLHESLTYHPLLTDALHSLLLCHILIQTSRTELLRHAHMVARLARICDGYPIFLAARSPARADWIEVLRRVGAKEWIGLEAGWEEICRPAPLPGHGKMNGAGGGGEMSPQERRKHEAVMEALADERVEDEESFRASARARELRAAREEEEEQRREYLRSATHAAPSTAPSHAAVAGEKDGGSTAAAAAAAAAPLNGEAKNASFALSSSASTPSSSPSPSSSSSTGAGGPKRWAQQDDGKEYPISTERAEALARWIKEALPPGAPGWGGEGGGAAGGQAKGRKKKTAGRKGVKKTVGAAVEIVEAEVENGVEGLSVD
ncbi:MAG: hypothetical protein Q9160_000119 [Pyrenula sp. 1 TL-2023]